VKAASDIYAPVDGEVIEANERLGDAPELVNGSPYGDGWIMRLKLARAQDVEELLDAAGYARTLAS
jgi:glycine cleavage system H protein